MKDTSNRFCVIAHDGRIVILGFPNPPMTEPLRLNVSEAVNLAAWLVALADPEGKEFYRILSEVRR